MNIFIRFILVTVLFANPLFADTIQETKKDSVQEKTESDIYFAAKIIHESFFSSDATIIDYALKYLQQDSIKVTIIHSIDDAKEVYYLTGDNKFNLFYNRSYFEPEKTKRKSEYFDVKENCYEFQTEGIHHNALYIRRLCFSIIDKELTLISMVLLDGD